MSTQSAYHTIALDLMRQISASLVQEISASNVTLTKITMNTRDGSALCQKSGCPALTRVFAKDRGDYKGHWWADYWMYTCRDKIAGMYRE